MATAGTTVAELFSVYRMTAHTWKIQGTKLPGLITDAILLDYELNELETVAITGTTIMVDVNEYGDGDTC